MGELMRFRQARLPQRRISTSVSVLDLRTGAPAVPERSEYSAPGERAYRGKLSDICGAVLGGKFHPEANCTDYLLQSLPPIPDRIPLLLGDAVHNLRVALDYLACELLGAKTEIPIGSSSVG